MQSTIEDPVLILDCRSYIDIPSPIGYFVNRENNIRMGQKQDDSFGYTDISISTALGDGGDME